MTEIYLLRHGQTALNSAMALQGRSDHPLNETGMAQAAEAGAWFRKQGIRFDRVYASPLRRAIQTAEAAAGECSIRVEPRLIEMDYGPYEGADLTALPPELTAFFRDLVHQRAPEGMEPLDQVVARLGAFLEELRREAPEGTILISTHAIAMKGALEYLTPDSRGGYWAKHIGNCAVYRTDLENGEYTIPKEVYPD